MEADTFRKLQPPDLRPRLQTTFKKSRIATASLIEHQ